jgi:preprotein translocase subunit SecG
VTVLVVVVVVTVLVVVTAVAIFISGGGSSSSSSSSSSRITTNLKTKFLNKFLVTNSSLSLFKCLEYCSQMASSWNTV